MRAAAIRLEALADDMDAEEAVEDAEGDHPDLKPRGLKVVGGID